MTGRLGMTAVTLRRWHQLYGLVPAGRTPGGHRRYSTGDLGRLESMCRLIDGGIPIREAAELSHRVGVADQAQLLAVLARTSVELDPWATTAVVSEVLRRHGVVWAWTQVLAPALRSGGEVFERTANGINAEHLLSECVRTALSAVRWQPRRWLRRRPVLLAAPDGEQHVLVLYALAAALAELGRPSVLLGASVPPRALADAVVHLDPGAVFLWSHAPATAVPPRLEPARPARTHRLPAVVLGGPGWPAGADGLVADLAGAVEVCSAAATTSAARRWHGPRT